MNMWCGVFHEAIQVLDDFRDRFIKEMDAKSVVHDLLHDKIVSDGDYQEITATRGQNQQNRVLHLSLKNCTDEVFRKACKIFIKSGEEGNSRMKALGEEMIAALNTGVCVQDNSVHLCVYMCVCTCGTYMCVCVYVSVCVCVHLCVYVCVLFRGQ